MNIAHQDGSPAVDQAFLQHGPDVWVENPTHREDRAAHAAELQGGSLRGRHHHRGEADIRWIESRLPRQASSQSRTRRTIAAIGLKIPPHARRQSGLLLDQRDPDAMGSYVCVTGGESSAEKAIAAP